MTNRNDYPRGPHMPEAAPTSYVDLLELGQYLRDSLDEKKLRQLALFLVAPAGTIAESIKELVSNGHPLTAVPVSVTRALEKKPA